MLDCYVNFGVRIRQNIGQISETKKIGTSLLVTIKAA